MFLRKSIVSGMHIPISSRNGTEYNNLASQAETTAFTHDALVTWQLAWKLKERAR
jgi:hypothetical protein